MPSYVYQARDPSGASVTGVIEAIGLDEAGRSLRREGKTVVDLRTKEPELGLPVAKPRRVRPDDVIFLTNQLSVMVDTGVPLTDALDGIAQQTNHMGLQVLVRDITEQVKAGVEFSTALMRHPKQFSDLYVNMVRASEASGTMGQMLDRLCDYMRSQREIRKQIRGAMAYPIGLLGFSLIVVVVMLTYVLPRFERIYAGKSATLPAPTRFLLGLRNFLTGQWMWIVGGLVVGIVGLVYYLRTPAGRLLADRFRLRTPLLGPLFHKVYVARSLRTLSTMLSAGVSMLESLTITSTVVGHIQFRQLWESVCEQLRNGRTLTEELQANPLIPHNVTLMISSGERTGNLPRVMDRVADFCESDLRIGVKSLTVLIEPAMIVIMGLIVGSIAISLLLPIFGISKVVAQ